VRRNPHRERGREEEGGRKREGGRGREGGHFCPGIGEEEKNVEPEH
jgi:hypothetical protein